MRKYKNITVNSNSRKSFRSDSIVLNYAWVIIEMKRHGNVILLVHRRLCATHNLNRFCVKCNWMNVQAAEIRKKCHTFRKVFVFVVLELQCMGVWWVLILLWRNSPISGLDLLHIASPHLSIHCFSFPGSYVQHLLGMKLMSVFWHCMYQNHVPYSVVQIVSVLTSHSEAFLQVSSYVMFYWESLSAPSVW